MVNYQNGKIYKIVSNQSKLIYIGSTTRNLRQRLAEHKSRFKKGILGQAREILKFNDAYIDLIEYYPCNSKEELFLREQHYIRIKKTINNKLPARTSKEHYKEIGRKKINCVCGASVNFKYFKKHKKTSYKHKKIIFDLHNIFNHL